LLYLYLLCGIFILGTENQNRDAPARLATFTKEMSIDMEFNIGTEVIYIDTEQL
jgi:hypothetical protein